MPSFNNFARGNNRYQPYGRGGSTRGGATGSTRFSMDVNHKYEENPVFTDLKEFKKNFYKESEADKLTSAEVQKFRVEHGMTLTGQNIPNPLLSFENNQFPQVINSIFKSNGFDKPTPIQSQGWPMALSGRNVIGIAQTGSGKTLSFILPALIHIMGQPEVVKGMGPSVLVMAPTRELACQIQQVAAEYGKVLGIRNSCLYGGAPKGKQIFELNRSPQIVIATPGRLLDLTQMGKTSLKNVTYLVLDEADRMLDMGFEKDLRKILAQIRPDRQMLMWSATWPKVVQKLARDFLGADNIKVQIGSINLKANNKIKQSVQVMDDSDKSEALGKLLVQIWDGIPGDEATKQMERTIIFVNKKYVCENIANGLWENSWNCATIHGDKTQQERDYALAEFKSGSCPILVATDVAARGLDVADLRHVINYDFPNGVEDFVHRIGRTCRGGDDNGNAYTFMTRNKQDRANAADLVNLMKDAGQEVPAELQSLIQQKRSTSSKWGRGGFGNRGRGGSRGYGRR
ncbi:hypothetical protein HK099_003276 [Clydaea vesicula]|uniref:RNA helicase n=1 Tax=Clydaea vesicula TaxID=447962 RepID=A0AAD5U1U2_9FUNG|nr:hypothetical protein HK099_003276 [Clydaea vesicula]KAJ3390610.1 hypothetical protein HDU92_000363 [Lobulomyces angularis]